MAKVKALKKVKKAKDESNIKNVEQRKVRAKDLLGIIAETFEKNSDGEFNLPAVLVRHTSGPKAKLGLHLEYYIPVTQRLSYYPPDHEKSKLIFMNQAGQVASEIANNNFPIHEVDMDIPLCKVHR